ncbi:ABC transporter ATP-binding protein [Aquicoccus sp. G2-2]|uniref:ABC transporter ATP-binding protein n=1 Tax=Aquicoccus sp. G2-2 TaxID=3092120 RepID=UPI002ADFD785|nr:ABC transporter ATP-binding protein [Aquicoccus sp. G2-2]MEA1114598.1 ABC transporter ATP-binding protein [Aquicoccus sp. G2-2]
MTNATPILEVRDATMRFGGFAALSNVSACFEKGKLTSIIGPNGAGKSTLFNILSGALVPSDGEVFLDGTGITGKRQHHFARQGISKSFQITNIFPELTALENVRIAVQAMTRRFDLWTPRRSLTGIEDRASALLDDVGLGAHKRRLASEISHGEQRALEIAMAIASDPKVLLLDEPTAGMSPEETVDIMALITRLAESCTVILVEHKMKLVMDVSDEILVLHHGEFLAMGTPDEIRENDDVVRVYLGKKRK